MTAKVLVAVHDPGFRDTLQEKLQRQKVTVAAAGTGQNAEEMVAQHDIDVVLLDVRDRGREAMRILSRIKQACPPVEVILLTNPDEINWSMEGMRQGATDDISVPFDTNRLIQKIQEAWHRKKARTKPKRRKSLFKIFENTMVAATFAQAGDFESANDITAENHDKEQAENRKQQE
ncbi:MAG: hypothetical protein A2521_13160 [Deltaproteobacteria bacterium RIFOXYD12_FULL_57_12]|nr:MAG: hypothetical protein A2521_13160 [Deltaproteobacteria bacterium RIFOXYD12_FULL_57_12]